MRSATPRQSKPGPRFEVLPGTRTVTFCIVNTRFILPAACVPWSRQPCGRFSHHARSWKYRPTAFTNAPADHQAAATADCSNTDPGGKPIHCATPISKYALGAQEENEFRVDR